MVYTNLSVVQILHLFGLHTHKTARIKKAHDSHQTGVEEGLGERNYNAHILCRNSFCGNFN